MEIVNIISPADVVSGLRANSKKQALQEIARRIAENHDLPERTVFDVLLERERLGATGVGRGVAIPHGKTDKATRIVGAFARMAAPIDFDAIDEQPVDLLFVMIAPETAGADHLKALASVSRTLRGAGLMEKIRQAKDADAIFSLLIGGVASDAA